MGRMNTTPLFYHIIEYSLRESIWEDKIKNKTTGLVILTFSVSPPI
jgi:hypothetical protein